MGSTQSTTQIKFQGRAIRVSDSDERKKVEAIYSFAQYSPWEALTIFLNQNFTSYYHSSTARATFVAHYPPINPYNGNEDLGHYATITIPKTKWNFEIELKDDDVGTVSWSSNGEAVIIDENAAVVLHCVNTGSGGATYKFYLA